MADFLDEELDIENIFTDESQLEETQEELTPEEKEKKKKEKPTELNEEELFPDSAESVSSEETQEQEDTDPAKKGKGTSPNTYSSLAIALKQDGILSELEDKDIEEVKDAESLALAIEKQVESRFETAQKRIKEALDNDVDVSDIRRFESTITYLNSIKEEDIKDETEKGENLRKQLIYTDLINKGFSKERATKKVAQSFDNGTDIEDALDALTENKEHFTNSYQKIIDDAKAENEAEKKRLKKDAEDLQKKILETESPFGELKLDKATRKLAFDAINKPIYKDEDGTYLTAVQKYQKENKIDFLHKLGVIFTLTDGFKDMNKLIKGAAAKEARKGLKELEHVLATSRNLNDGGLQLMGAGGDDNESYSGLRLDV